MPTESLTAELVQALRIHVYGRVQGLGVRPAAARVAARLGLNGRVANTRDGVTIELEGEPTALKAYLDEFIAALPPGATVERTIVEEVESADRFSAFEIVARTEAGPGLAPVPADRNVCASCLREVRDPSDRRYGYPFTSCTDCGPRCSIIEAMPYDRAATTMQRFTLCPACGREFRTQNDRRFHAQTNACPECGPQVRSIDADGHAMNGAAAIAAAAVALRRGRIVAIKGLGGYQLLVDATSPEAVRRLREKKGRRTKPLAVFVGSLAEAERIALLNEDERRLLVDPSGPIVVVRRRGDASLAADVAPGMHSIGLLLPTTPLHALLCDEVARPLVCTSGNREGEPLVFEDSAADRELAELADLRLEHDRPIARPIDDSVVRVVAGAPCVLRLGRGLAPLSMPQIAGLGAQPIVALGGEQKGAIALWNGSQTVLGPHIGDLTSAATCERWSEQVAAFMAFYGVSWEDAVVVHDRHPDYFSSRWAERFRSRIAVQHHHAHIAAVLLEHGRLERDAVGLAWDGTGYGDDGTIWGGETLKVAAGECRRIGRLRPFPLLGGERAVREPYRVAIALVCAALGCDAAKRLSWSDVESGRVARLLDVAHRARLCIDTSSMGRLFDGVAALVLGLAVGGDEGRPAMLLEEACDTGAAGSYRFGVGAVDGEIDWRPVVVAVVEDLSRGVPPGAIAMRFHRAIAERVCAVSETYPGLPLVTSGGVLQNAVLGELIAERLSARPAGWLRAIAVPPGDGGLALGQLAVAVAVRRRAGERE